MIPFGQPQLGEAERAAVQEVMAGTVLTHGPRVKEFEQSLAAFTGAPYAVATATCAAALHLAYLGIEVGPGDEVLVPAQTHVAMAHAVEVCGARPVFVDSEPTTGNVDMDQLESLAGPRVRAVSVVHYLGRPVDMDRVNEIAARHGLFVVEDCAIALGARFRGTHVGLHGDMGCFSFYPVKHITTGEGGMVITRREEVSGRVSKQRAFGIDRSVLADRRHTGMYDVELLGLNYRLGEVAAAIGVEQMKRLPGFLEARARNFEALAGELAELDQLEVLRSGSEGDFESGHYCLVAVLRPPLDGQRDEIVDQLKSDGVATSVYYPRALPDTTYYRETYGYREGSFPVASRISSSSIAFPVGPHLGEGDIERMVAAVRAALAGAGAHV